VASSSLLLQKSQCVERNYEIHDKEMLAVIRALEDWRHFLEGPTTRSKFGRTTRT